MSEPHGNGNGGGDDAPRDPRERGERPREQGGHPPPGPQSPGPQQWQGPPSHGLPPQGPPQRPPQGPPQGPAQGPPQGPAQGPPYGPPQGGPPLGGPPPGGPPPGRPPGFGPGGPPGPPYRQSGSGWAVFGTAVAGVFIMGMINLGVALGVLMIAEMIGSDVAIGIGAALLAMIAFIGGFALIRVRRPWTKGLGLGLMIGWALISVVSAGYCTGLNPNMYT